MALQHAEAIAGIMACKFQQYIQLMRSNQTEKINIIQECRFMEMIGMHLDLVQSALVAPRSL